MDAELSAEKLRQNNEFLKVKAQLNSTKLRTLEQTNEELTIKV